MKIFYQLSFSISKKPVMATLLLLLLITSQGKSGMTDWLFVSLYGIIICIAFTIQLRRPDIN